MFRRLEKDFDLNFDFSFGFGLFAFNSNNKNHPNAQLAKTYQNEKKQDNVDAIPVANHF